MRPAPLVAMLRAGNGSHLNTRYVTMKKTQESPRFESLRVADRRRGDALRAPRFDQQPACRFCGEDCDGLH